jgi:hypothetical protein
LSKCPIQKREALAIVKKLGAALEKDGPHQMATFEVGGKAILTFGVRQGGAGGHGHLAGRYKGDLKISENRVVALANCNMSKDEYIQHLKDIGEIAV